MRINQTGKWQTTWHEINENYQKLLPKKMYKKLYASTIMRHNKFENITCVSRDHAHSKFSARGLHSNSNIVSGELEGLPLSYQL